MVTGDLDLDLERERERERDLGLERGIVVDFFVGDLIFAAVFVGDGV